MKSYQECCAAAGFTLTLLSGYGFRLMCLCRVKRSSAALPNGAEVFNEIIILAPPAAAGHF